MSPLDIVSKLLIRLRQAIENVEQIPKGQRRVPLVNWSGCLGVRGSEQGVHCLPDGLGLAGAEFLRQAADLHRVNDKIFPCPHCRRAPSRSM